MKASHNNDSLTQVCEDVKNLGYAASGTVRLYGEEFEVMSDPFPEDDGIAVQARTKKDSRVRTVQLPATIVKTVKGRRLTAA